MVELSRNNMAILFFGSALVFTLLARRKRHPKSSDSTPVADNNSSPIDSIQSDPITLETTKLSAATIRGRSDIMVIGIAGGSGSGKTTLASSIYNALGKANCAYIMHDSYYKDMTHLTLREKEKLNFDHPESLDTALLVEHVQLLKSNKPANIPTYNFSTHSRSETVVVIPRPIVIVEGILIFTDPTLCGLFDLKVFVDTACDIRLIRRIKRDTQERGRTFDSVIDQYTQTVRPMYHKYVKSSMTNADMVIQHGINAQAQDCIVSYLKKFVEDGYSGDHSGGESDFSM